MACPTLEKCFRSRCPDDGCKCKVCDCQECVARQIKAEAYYREIPELFRSKP